MAGAAWGRPLSWRRVEQTVPNLRPKTMPGEAGVGPESRQARPFLRAGDTCWRLESAARAAVLVDAAAYFAELERALVGARHSIMIIGWDFDWRIRLRPDASTEEADQLGPVLRSLVEARSELTIHILIWSVAVVHGSSGVMALLREAPWARHPRIHFKLDTRHPIYASHHQKFVVIDDALAFAGGIDLTAERWDTPVHRAAEPHRRAPDGASYGPVHDLQMMVDGPAAAALGELARWRWRRATDESLAPPPVVAGGWPQHLEPHFRDVEIGIARTAPAWIDEPAIRESAALVREAIERAREILYIETQYLASFAIGDRLARSLEQRNGPEIVILVIRQARGVLEHFAMGGNRDRLIRRLMRADRYDRLRVMFAVVPDGDAEREVLVHGKLIIVDDVLLRIGSANLNDRSQGLDTECDLAIEATDPGTMAAIAGLRTRLLAEHLDTDPERVRLALQAEGSLIRAIERLNTRPRGLRRYAIDPARGPTRPLAGSRLLDPAKPLEPLWRLRF
jgi:phosphatidylserine/phosphatidylglycerophosphate/cardiolipin synthase-like enzyme